MCLILFAWKVHPAYLLVLAANRDEYYARPSAPAAFWDDAPDLLAGRDLKAGGTWLGITRSGRLAALTNYRDPASLKQDAPSRGHLVSDYLRNQESSDAYLKRLAARADRYNGFSLLVGDCSALFVYSNRSEAIRLNPGIYGMSNHLLDTPWPKVSLGKQSMERILAGRQNPSPDALLDLLASRSRPPDDLLPDTGVGPEWERILSPLFIESPSYGTRCSTVLLIDRQGAVTFVEKVFNGGSESKIPSRFDFRIADAAG
jgi:uncharacterized protein with NRDE domain